MTLNEIKEILYEYKLSNYDKREVDYFLGFLKTRKQNLFSDFFNFDMECLENFKIDLLDQGIPASVLKETFEGRINKKGYIDNIFIEDHANKEFDEFLLQAQMVQLIIPFVKNKRKLTKEDLRDYILASNVVFLKKMEYLEKTINYPRFTNIYKKYFSKDENKNIQFLMLDSIKIGISFFLQCDLITLNEKSAEEIDEYLVKLL